MATWSDAALGVGVAAASGWIGVRGTLTATRAQARHAAAEREESQRTARVERVAAVIGPIRTLLIDLFPQRIQLTYGPTPLGRQWLDTLADKWVPRREELAVLGALEPTAGLRESLRQLQVAIDELFNRLFLSLDPQHADHHRESYQQAMDAYRGAESHIKAILDSVHGGKSNGGGARSAENDREDEAPAAEKSA